MPDPLLVAIGAAVGAPARYLLDRAVMQRVTGAFPWGTLLVNVLGSLVLGLVLGAALPPPARLLLGVGFCGALTTFSTFGYETQRLLDGGARRTALLNVVVSVLACVAAVAAGIAIGSLRT
ncbi:MAG: fluoride efflux transporter CrcB [Candidatus Nanopelagicales bacterium]